MATASAQAAAPSAAPRAPLARRALPAVATVVGVAVLLKLVHGPWYLNYDARYALLWARDLVEGHTPEYTADFAPTPHPLETAASLLAVPFGDGGDAIMLWIILLAFGLLTWLTYRLGAQLFHPWVGIVAAVVVATRPALERDALLGYQDTAFACLIVGAVLLEAKQRRRGEPVLALLALAGLMRPEAWVLGGLYFLWMWPVSDQARRLRLAALTAIAPLVWAGADWAVTGDPLHSLHGTADLAEAVDRRRDVVDGPYWALQYAGYALREPVVAGLPIGLYFAWRFKQRQAWLPLAAIAAMIAVFLVGPVFGLPLIGRYVRTSAVLLTLFYGLAVAGFMLLHDPRQRRIWTWIGGATAALSIAFLPWHVGMLADVERRIDRDGALYTALRETGRSPAVRQALERCGGKIVAADHRPLPHLRYWLGTAPGSVGTVANEASEMTDVLLLPRNVPLMRRFYQENYPRLDPPPGYTQIWRNEAWRVFASADCVTRLPT